MFFMSPIYTTEKNKSKEKMKAPRKGDTEMTRPAPQGKAGQNGKRFS